MAYFINNGKVGSLVIGTDIKLVSAMQRVTSIVGRLERSRRHELKIWYELTPKDHLLGAPFQHMPGMDYFYPILYVKNSKTRGGRRTVGDSQGWTTAHHCHLQSPPLPYPLHKKYLYIDFAEAW